MAFKKALSTIVTAVVIILVISFIVTLFVFAARSSKSDDEGSPGTRVTDTLKFIVVISRHGNRGTTDDYPNDPYPHDDPKYYPYGDDGLTPYGRVQMFKLGVKVRSMYNGFLNSTFYSEDLHASSTYMDRLLMSGEAFLAGLYPPHGFQIWNKNVKWQPTPLYSDSPDKTLIILSSSCPRYDEEVYQCNIDFLKEYSADISKWAAILNYTGPDDISLKEDLLFTFWDKVISEDTEGFVLPEWTKQLYPNTMKKYMGDEYISSSACTDEVVRLFIGELYTQMVNGMQSKINGTLTNKMYYYSGHDCSIVSLQGVLGIPKSDIIGLVRPGSAMIWELHQNPNSSRYYMQVLFIDGGSADLEPVELQVPNCGVPCDFDLLLNNTQKFMNVDYEQECQTSSSSRDFTNFPKCRRRIRA